MIVDDDIVMTTFLETCVDWKSEGFILVPSASNGKVAYSQFLNMEIDVILTDIKMPHMDGLEFIKKIKDLPNSNPLIYVLSAYEDFPLVRKAFTFGAIDYVPKAELTSEKALQLAKSIRNELKTKKVLPSSQDNILDINQNKILEVIEGRGNDTSFIKGPYCMALFTVDCFYQIRKNYDKDLDSELCQPILSFTSNIQRLRNKGTFIKVDYDKYLLIYQNGSATKDKGMEEICKKLQNIWKTFMNITLSAAISPIYNFNDDFLLNYKDLDGRLNLTYLFGFCSIIPPSIKYPKGIPSTFPSASSIFINMRKGELISYEEERTLIISEINNLSLEEAKEIAISYLYSLAMHFHAVHIDFRRTVDSRIVNYNGYDDVMKLDSSYSISLWLSSLFNACNIFSIELDKNKISPIEKASRYIRLNYGDPNISLGMVAEQVGLNDRYFAYLFKNEVGKTFVHYLTEIRMNAANKLLEQTNMKVYEISSSIGYSNVEHFSRVYKKYTGISPKRARKV
jgi:YesN/AraC family two-component response regulator